MLGMTLGQRGTMRVIAVTNQKGGSGKTTTTVSLGAALAGLNKRVLLIDLDPQRNLTWWLKQQNHIAGISDVLFEGIGIGKVSFETEIPNLSLAPATEELMVADRKLIVGKFPHTTLKEKLSKVKAWDYVLIDCPPSLHDLTLNALTAAEEVIVPVEATFFGIWGLVKLEETLYQVRERFNPKLKLTGILAFKTERTLLTREVLKELKKRYPKEVFNTEIRKNIRLAEAPSWQQPISVYAPDSHGAQDYLKFAKEIIKKGKQKGAI